MRTGWLWSKAHYFLESELCENYISLRFDFLTTNLTLEKKTTKYNSYIINIYIKYIIKHAYRNSQSERVLGPVLPDIILYNVIIEVV